VRARESRGAAPHLFQELLELGALHAQLRGVLHLHNLAVLAGADELVLCDADGVELALARVARHPVVHGHRLQALGLLHRRRGDGLVVAQRGIGLSVTYYYYY
jgi:hypothetical protein